MLLKHYHIINTQNSTTAVNIKVYTGFQLETDDVQYLKNQVGLTSLCTSKVKLKFYHWPRNKSLPFYAEILSCSFGIKVKRVEIYLNCIQS